MCARTIVGNSLNVAFAYYVPLSEWRVCGIMCLTDIFLALRLSLQHCTVHLGTYTQVASLSCSQQPQGTHVHQS